jgi:hypothetical protein
MGLKSVKKNSREVHAQKLFVLPECDQAKSAADQLACPTNYAMNRMRRLTSWPRCWLRTSLRSLLQAAEAPGHVQ